LTNRSPPQPLAEAPDPDAGAAAEPTDHLRCRVFEAK
jgi:hypothetical protein